MQRIQSLQALRGMACLSIFLMHCQVPNCYEWATSIFIMLSGFVMTYRCLVKQDKPDCSLRAAVSLSIKKTQKSYSLHLLTLLAFLVLELYQNRYSFYPGYWTDLGKRLLPSLLLVQSWIPTPKYFFAFNGVAWYLSAAAFFYVCFPFLFRAIGLYRKQTDAYRIVIILVFASFALGVIGKTADHLIAHRVPDPAIMTRFHSIVGWFYYISPIFRLIDFAIGCNLGYLFFCNKGEIEKKQAAWIDISMVLSFAIAVFLYRWNGSVFYETYFRKTQLFLPFCILAISSFSYHKGPISRVFTNRFFCFMGNISAAFFLIHQCYIEYLTLFLERFPFRFEIDLFLVILGSWLFTVLSCLVWDWLRARSIKTRLFASAGTQQ